MSGSCCAFRVLALAAMLAAAANSSAAERRSTASLETPDAEESVDEPILLIPKTSASTRSGASTRSDAAASNDLAPRKVAPPKSVKASTADVRPSRKADGKVVAAAVDEAPRSSSSTGSASSSSTSTKSVATNNANKPQMASARPTSGEEFAAPPLFEGPNPGYHPARVPRKSAGWYFTGMEPAGHDPAPTPVPEGEPIPMPEGTFEGDDFMSFDDGMADDTFFSGGGNFLPSSREWAVIAGGEWLLIRPHFSQAVGMTETIHTQDGARAITTENQMNFNPGYQGAFRAYLGFRNCYCGDEVRFGFFNLNAADNLNGTATSNTQFCDFLCNTTPNPGDSVNTHFNLGASLWDLDCVRPFFFNPPCNDCCGPRCHPWDLRWFGGVRFAYINHSISSLVTDARQTDGILSTASATNRFTGFGLRMGLQARKYFGQQGRFSVYGRGAGSLLVGNDYQNVSSATSSTISSPTAAILNAHNSRIVPVAEIEFGGTLFLTQRFAVSGGWMLMSFWDLGLQETGSMSTPSFDTSNILGFDGFFVRGEFIF